mmetsp:Transcript_43241/g.87437  ORF Transcript_43241/g.87437 Transcript_43241/m.87437 type:complete len:89 (-) Transcript_43241:951-1217(-)
MPIQQQQHAHFSTVCSNRPFLLGKAKVEKVWHSKNFANGSQSRYYQGGSVNFEAKAIRVRASGGGGKFFWQSQDVFCQHRMTQLRLEF